ncbi:hypothetical protein G7054_g13585 [Neopestalotiopsis clavispora]|nr:hypothetical protein G7054_g13585 [Neopestalotiopsis clavispora]
MICWFLPRYTTPTVLSTVSTALLSEKPQPLRTSPRGHGDYLPSWLGQRKKLKKKKEEEEEEEDEDFNCGALWSTYSRLDSALLRTLDAVRPSVRILLVAR